MQFICMNLFILVTTLICTQRVYSGILVHRNENVEDKYSGSDQQIQMPSTEQNNSVKEDDLTVPLASDIVQSFDVISKKGQAPSETNKETLQSTTVPKVRELFLGKELESLNRTRKSITPPRPAVCFEFPSQNLIEPPTRVCEPINVARQAPSDVNIVSYNPYMGSPHSSTPLVVLPPFHLSQLKPTKTTVHPSRFPPGYGLQSTEDRYMPPLLYPLPTAQLPPSFTPSSNSHLNPANTSTYSSSWLPDYGFQPAGSLYISPPKNNMATSKLPLSPMSELNLVKIMLPLPWPSSYGFQPAENSYMSLSKQYMTPAELPIILPPRPMRQTNPAMIIVPPTWPPGCRLQQGENCHISIRKQRLMRTQLPIILPPHLMRESNVAITVLPPTWPPGCRIQPGENCHISIPNQHLMPIQLPVNLPASPMSEVNPPKTKLPSPWPSRYERQPVENSYMSPPDQYLSPTQLTASLPPFKSEMKPDRAMFLSSWPSGYGFQTTENRYMSPSYHHFPSAQLPPRRPTSQIYYINPHPTPAYPVSYTPYSFSAFGNINKLQSPHHKTPANATTPKTGLLNTIREQEGKHKIPTPLEEAEKSQGGLSSRSASIYPYIVPQKFPINPYFLNMANNEYLAESNDLVPDRVYPTYEYSPSSVVHFTHTPTSSHVPVTTHTTKFGPFDPPVALTCKVHNSEEKEAKQTLTDDSIAILQLFVKPNNKYRKNAPQTVANINGSFNARESVKRPMVQYAEKTTNTSLQNDGVLDVSGSMAKVKEDGISPQGEKGISEDKSNIEGMNWLEDQEQRGMQEYLKQELLHRRGVDIPVLQTDQPGVWHQGYFSASQVPFNSERYYSNNLNVGQRPYYHPSYLPDQNRVSLQWWGVPQTQLWAPEYRQKTQFLPDQQSLVKQELRNNQLLLESNQKSLHLQERLQDLIDNPSSESEQGKINEAIEKQMRLDAVKAKLLQRYQSEAVEKRQEARQMSPSAGSKDTDSSSRSAIVQLNTSFPNMEKRKASDSIGATVQGKLENAIPRNSTTADVSRNNIRDENATGTTQSNIKADLHDPRPISGKEKNLPSQAEMPANSEQILKKKETKGRYSTVDTGLEASGSSSTDEPLGIETKSSGNLNDGMELDGKKSYGGEGIASGLEGRSGNQRTTISYEMSSYSGEITAYTETSAPRWNSNSQNERFQEGNNNGDVTRYPERAVTYAVERTIVPDIFNGMSHNINQSTESASSSDNTRKKKSDQIALKINSSDVPRANNISEDEFVSKNQPLHKENAATTITLENKEISTIMASTDTSEMMMKTPMKIESDISKQENTTNFKQLVRMPEPEFRTENSSEFQSNETDSPAIINTDIHSINYITSAEKMSLSDILTHSAESNIFHDANESTSEVKKREKSFSASLFTSKPAASVTTEISAQQRHMISLNHVSDTQLTSDDVIINPEATMLPEENTTRSVTWNSSSSNDRNGNALSNSTASGHEISLKNTEIVRGSKSPIKTETRAFTDFAAGEISNGTSEISDDGSSKTEEAANVPKSLEDFKMSYRMRSEAEEPSRIGGITADQVSNTSNNIAYTSPTNNYVSSSNINQAELLGMGGNQKNRASFTGDQMNLGGFPQMSINDRRMGHSQDGSIRNIKMNRTSVIPQLQPIFPSSQIWPAYGPASVHPEAMGFLVYPHRALPTQVPNYIDERDSRQLSNMIPYYPIPVAPPYPLGPSPYIYSNNPLKSIYQDITMPAEKISKPAVNNNNGQKIEGKLPFIVVLEQN